MKLNIITLLFFSFCIGQNTELFDKGNDLYNQGRYLEAIESYSDIIKDGKHSSCLLYTSPRPLDLVISLMTCYS